MNVLFNIFAHYLPFVLEDYPEFLNFVENEKTEVRELNI